MSQLIVKTVDNFGNETFESIESYCVRVGKKNNSVLYKLENYLGKKLLSDEALIEIRDIILTVSAEVTNIPKIIERSE
ncbi:hypothetical protein AB1283_00580 [Bacillus sp. S13(2024)]|uniref:hypothetical protein n=1 Tax=Bacillus sp. S13(2024) TaxID=3162885 RepID=UPI003D1F7E86